MSTTHTEDEWQAVEDNLKALSIKDQAQSQQQSVNSLDPSGDSNGQAEAVDTALMNALLNPRERMVLFHIEDAILNFMKSNDRLMELPQCNSFRRLLYYRLGQRFGLCHTTTDQITETGERTIVLYKTATSSFPSVLLIDLAAQYPLDPTASDGGNYSNNAHNSNNNSGRPSPVQQGLTLNNPAYSAPNTNANSTRKVQVMKRKPARTDTSSTKSNTSSKNAQSVEDKEKAYNEARARIFGDTGTSDGGSTGGNNSPCPEDDGESGNNSGVGTPRSEVYGDAKSNNSNAGASVSGNSSVVDADSTTATQGSTPAYSNTSLSNQSSSASLSVLGDDKSNASSTKEGNAAVSGIAEKRNTEPASTNNNRIDANNTYNNNNTANRRNNNYNNSNNRAQVRNIDAERSDPDFVRRSNVARSTSGGSSGNNNYYNNNASGGNNYNNSNYNNQPRYNNNNSPNPQSMPYPMDPHALYLQQQQQMQQMQYNMQGMPPQNTPEAVQMQLQMQMQYQQMQLQMLAQQQQLMGANPYYPNNNVPSLPTPQGYGMSNNGQSSPVPYGVPAPGYGTPYNPNDPNYGNNYASQYPPHQQQQPQVPGRGNNSGRSTNSNNKQYKNDFPPLG